MEVCLKNTLGRQGSCYEDFLQNLFNIHQKSGETTGHFGQRFEQY